MRVTALADAAARPRRVALGSFDGIHRGHQEVLRGCDTLVTFSPHPLEVLTGIAPPSLDGFADAGDVFRRLGIIEAVVIPFDREIASLPPQQFVDDVLVAALNVISVSVGKGFRFGSRAAGSTDDLEADRRFEARIVGPVRIDGEVVSSTGVRAAIAAGSVEHAARLLGRPFALPVRRIPGVAAELEPIAGAAVPAPGEYECLLHNRRVRAVVGTGIAPRITLPDLRLGSESTRLRFLARADRTETLHPCRHVVYNVGL